MPHSPVRSAVPQSSDPVRQADEVHVLLGGLDPVAATVALLLADAGVCLINVSDPGPVSAQDTATGPYPPAFEGSPREYALRKLLRARWPRCVPLSAPELFCSSVVPTAVMLRSSSVAGPLPHDLTELGTRISPDAQLPAITVVTDGSVSLTWPVDQWYRRPCRDCMVDAVRTARTLLRHTSPHGAEAIKTPHSPALTTLTRVVTASEIAVRVLARALVPEQDPGLEGHPRLEGHSGVEGDHGSGEITLQYGLHRAFLAPRTDCLCGWDG